MISEYIDTLFLNYIMPMSQIVFYFYQPQCSPFPETVDVALTFCDIYGAF